MSATPAATRKGAARGKKIWVATLGGIALGIATLIVLGGRMTELTHEVFIRAPADKIWIALADLEAVKHYNPGVAEARYISQQREGIGAARECRLKSQELLKERVIGWEPGRVLTMELYESAWPIRNMRWRTAIIPAEGGARVSQKLQYEPKGLMGRIMNPLAMKRTIDKSVGQVFEELKRYVEDGGTPARSRP